MGVAPKTDRGRDLLAGGVAPHDLDDFAVAVFVLPDLERRTFDLEFAKDELRFGHGSFIPVGS